MAPSRFSKDIIWNLLGQAAPMIAAFISIPILIHEIGTDKFGVLTIAWMLIGYFSLFDFGIGRALTQLISQRLAAEQKTEVTQLMWTGNLIMLALGILAAIVLVVCRHDIIYDWLNIPAALQQEAALSLLTIAPAITLTVITTGMRSVLEAYQEFKAINLLRIPLGIFMFVAPVAVLPFSHSLVPIFCSLTFARLVMALLFLWLCTHKIPSFWQISFSRAEVPILFSFGGWMTVSNVISPIMVQMDRFFIGALLTISAVTYYTTPYEVIIKMLIVPAAVASVAFPEFARLHKNQQTDDIRKVYKKSLLYASTLIFPMLIALLGAPLILKLWLNESFVRESTIVMQILAVGVFINGLAQVPYALIQGMGHPHITATLHMIEVVIYVPLLLVLIRYLGINGAALAWLIRVSFDTCALFYIARQKMAHMKKLTATMP